MKSGGSYLSQSELPVTFGLGQVEAVERAVIHWPSGQVDEHRKLKPGRYDCTEGQGIRRTA